MWLPRVGRTAPSRSSTSTTVYWGLYSKYGMPSNNDILLLRSRNLLCMLDRSPRALTILSPSSTSITTLKSPAGQETEKSLPLRYTHPSHYSVPTASIVLLLSVLYDGPHWMQWVSKLRESPVQAGAITPTIRRVTRHKCVSPQPLFLLYRQEYPPLIHSLFSLPFFFSTHFHFFFTNECDC